MSDKSDSLTIEYTDRPPVLVFADDSARGVLARQAVAEAGGRVSAELPINEAIERIEAQATLSAVVIEVRDDAGAALDALLARVDRGATDGRFTSVVTVPAHLIDVASASIQARGVTLLCDPTPMERTAAINEALTRRSAHLADVGSGLKELADEVARIAKTLQTLASEDNSRSVMVPSAPRGQTGQAGEAAIIRAMIRVRRLRNQFFPAELFADPAWDMLLDLMAARLEGRAVAVSSLCIASAVPPTTALRWIKTLTDARLFERVADSNDGRRVFIELTDVAEQGMIAYLVQLQRTLTLKL
jgi:prefoldin subunit 5